MTVPFEVGVEIKLATLGFRNGFGSVRVLARIDAQEFETSLFPDKASGSFLLPVKASVRKALGLTKGQTIEVSLSLI